MAESPKTEMLDVSKLTGDGLDVARPAPKRALTLAFQTWMALARAQPLEGTLDLAQGCLGGPAGDPAGGPAARDDG